MCRMSWKSGSLNLLELSGPHRACYGTPLPLRFFYFAWEKIQLPSIDNPSRLTETSLTRNSENPATSLLSFEPSLVWRAANQQTLWNSLRFKLYRPYTVHIWLGYIRLTFIQGRISLVRHLYLDVSGNISHTSKIQIWLIWFPCPVLALSARWCFAYFILFSISSDVV